MTTFFSATTSTPGLSLRGAPTIGPDENVGSVYDRLMHIGADLTLDTRADIVAGPRRGY